MTEYCEAPVCSYRVHKSLRDFGCSGITRPEATISPPGPCMASNYEGVPNNVSWSQQRRRDPGGDGMQPFGDPAELKEHQQPQRQWRHVEPQRVKPDRCRGCFEAFVLTWSQIWWESEGKTIMATTKDSRSIGCTSLRRRLVVEYNLCRGHRCWGIEESYEGSPEVCVSMAWRGKEEHFLFFFKNKIDNSSLKVWTLRWLKI